MTKKLFRRPLIVICALICLAMNSAAQPDRPDRKDAQPNFTGTWRLNRELSDKPQEKIKEAIGNRGRALGRMRSGGAAQDRLKSLEGMAEVLKIVHNDPEIQVTGKNDVSRRIFTDGRKVSITSPNGESLETTARWQGSQLVIVTQRASGGKVTQTYRLGQDGRQMTVLTQIAGQRLDRPIEIRFVYDAEAGQ